MPKRVIESGMLEGGSVEEVIAQLQPYVGRGAHVSADYDGRIEVWWSRDETKLEAYERRQRDAADRKRLREGAAWAKVRAEGLAEALVKAKNMSPAEAEAREREHEELEAAGSADEFMAIRERHLKDRETRAAGREA